MRSPARGPGGRPDRLMKKHPCANIRVCLIGVDRYVQKQLTLRAKEKADVLEQKKYEMELRQRTIRASKGSRTVADEMLARQQEALKKSRDKFISMKEKLEKEEKEKAEAKRRKRQEALSKPVPGLDGPSWKEMKEEAEKKRQDRLNKLRVDNARLKTPQVEKESLRAEREEKLRRKEPTFKPFKAEDPDKVLMKLSKQQKAWDATLQEAKTRNRIRKAAELTQIDPSVVSMEKRILLRQARSRERAEQKKAMEEEVFMKKNQEEKLKQDKLLHSKQPISRPTKTTENRAKLVRKSLEDLELQQLKEMEKERRRQCKLKAVGAIVSSVVKEFDTSRKSKLSYVELRTGDQLKAYNDEAREDFKRKFRENKKRINASAKSMPTLIERHDQAIAANEAHKAAMARKLKGTGVRNKPRRISGDRSSDDYSYDLMSSERHFNVDDFSGRSDDSYHSDHSG